jgi:hypothetical protein
VLKKTQMGGRRALRDPSDIGRIGVIGHERELLVLRIHKEVASNQSATDSTLCLSTDQFGVFTIDKGAMPQFQY